MNNVDKVIVETFDPEHFSDPEYLYNNEFYSPISIVDKTYMCFLNNIVIVDRMKPNLCHLRARFKHNNFPSNQLPYPRQKPVTTLPSSVTPGSTPNQI